MQLARPMLFSKYWAQSGESLLTVAVSNIKLYKNNGKLMLKSSCQPQQREKNSQNYAFVIVTHHLALQPGQTRMCWAILHVTQMT